MTKEDIKYLKSLGLSPNDVEDYMQDGGTIQNNQQSELNQQEQIMQIIQMFAKINKINPQEIIKKLQSSKPEEQQKMIQQMALQVEEFSKQNQNNNVEMENPQMMYGGYKKYFQNGGLQNLYKSNQGNVEAEDDEHVLTPQGTSFELNGKTHSQGGIDLELPSNTMVFSEKIKAPKEIISQVLNKEIKDLNKSEKKYSFADLAGKFSTEKDFKNLKKSDDIYSKKSIELNIQKKLPKLVEVFENQERYKFGLGMDNDYEQIINSKNKQVQKYGGKIIARKGVLTPDNNNLFLNEYGKPSNMVTSEGYYKNGVYYKNTEPNNHFWSVLPNSLVKTPYTVIPKDYGSNQTKQNYINSWIDMSKQIDLQNLREYQVSNYRSGIQDFYNNGLIPYENYGEEIARKKGYKTLKEALEKDPYFGTTQYINNRWGNRGIAYDNSKTIEELSDTSKYTMFTNELGKVYYTNKSGYPTIYESSNNRVKEDMVVLPKIDGPISTTNDMSLMVKPVPPPKITNDEVVNSDEQYTPKMLDPLTLNFNKIRNANYANAVDNLLSNINEINRPIMLRRPPLQSLNQAIDLPEMSNIAMNKGLSSGQYNINQSGNNSLIKQALYNDFYTKTNKQFLDNIPESTKYYTDNHNTNNNIIYNNALNQYKYDIEALPNYYKQNDMVDKGIYQNRKENYQAIANMRNNEAKIEEQLNNLLLNYNGRIDKNGNVIIDKNLDFQTRDNLRRDILKIASNPNLTPQQVAMYTALFQSIPK